MHHLHDMLDILPRMFRLGHIGWPRGWFRVLMLALTLCWLPGPGWTAPAVSDGALFVFSQQGCSYCMRFEQEVGTVYPKTAIGRRFPMMRIDVNNPPPAYRELAETERFTPAFLVVDSSGREVARFRGYHLEEFFWAEMEAIAQRFPHMP